MHFVSIVNDCSWRLNQSLFWPRAEVSFPCAHQFSEYNRKEASASREVSYWNDIVISYRVYTKGWDFISFSAPLPFPLPLEDKDCFENKPANAQWQGQTSCSNAPQYSTVKKISWFLTCSSKHTLCPHTIQSQFKWSISNELCFFVLLKGHLPYFAMVLNWMNHPTYVGLPVDAK